MQFSHFDLGRLLEGQIVEIVLEGNAANVRLMDDIHYNRFKNGLREYQFVGGHATTSPIRLKTPHDGHWHVTIDFGGNGGRGKCAVRLLSNLPEL